MKYFICLCPLLFSISQAQANPWMREEIRDDAPTITYTTLNQQEQDEANHWGFSEAEWFQYQKYMALEGKYFYEKVDPLTVMVMITEDTTTRNRYLQKQIQFERKKVAREVAMANDVWRMQRALYGVEPLVDFQKLPWMDDEVFDRRTIKQEIPIEAPSNANKILNQERSETFQNSDELWVIMDETCDGCYQQINQLSDSQPLKVVIVSLIREPKVLQNWVKKTGLNELVNSGKARLSLYDPLVFPETPSVNALYHVRNGHILRALQ